MKGDSGTGVPEALPRALRVVAERLGVETLDRVWIFPPLVRGRREWGLVAVSRFAPGDRDRRSLFTAAYSAERTGQGVVVSPVLTEEGSAPLDRLPRVMQGVVQRSGDTRGEAREVAIGGDVQAFDQLVLEIENEPPGAPGRRGGP